MNDLAGPNGIERLPKVHDHSFQQAKLESGRYDDDDSDLEGCELLLILHPTIRGQKYVEPSFGPA
jgi:hypothetical protein